MKEAGFLLFEVFHSGMMPESGERLICSQFFPGWNTVFDRLFTALLGVLNFEVLGPQMRRELVVSAKFLDGIRRPWNACFHVVEQAARGRIRDVFDTKNGSRWEKPSVAGAR